MTAAAPGPILEWTSARIADAVDEAAALIDAHGLYTDGYWPPELQSSLDTAAVWWGDYVPGAPCCAAGALAVATGACAPGDPIAGFEASGWCRPVLDAVLTHLGLRDRAELFAWSDGSDQATVVAKLRRAAADIRGEGDPS